VALSGLAAASPVGWSIPSLIASRGGTGTIGGIMNFLNNMMGVVAPMTTGYIVGATGSFVGAFLAAGIVLVHRWSHPKRRLRKSPTKIRVRRRQPPLRRGRYG